MSTDTREVRTLEDALALVDEWAAAYRALQLDYLKLAERHADAQWWAEHHQWMRDNAQLFKPAPKRRSPFDEPAEVA